MDTHALDQRRQFVAAVASTQWSMSELCARFGISRPTGYKWLARYAAGGDAALRDRSRAPQTHPHRIDAEVAALVVAARRQYGWGARKLLRVLQTQQPERAWPVRSTVNALLAREGLLRRRPRHVSWAHPGAARLQTTRPNEVWPADFKGHFKTGDGRYCYPLTITDHCSRSLLACDGLLAMTTVDTRRRFEAVFRAVGLPDAIEPTTACRLSGPARSGSPR